MSGEITRLNRVMVVDDERFDQMAYERTLNKSGRVDEVIVFGYAEQALEYLIDPETEKVDVIFLDINMPRMNGFDFLDAILQTAPNDFNAIVVVMLTTSLDPKDRARAELFECVKAYLNKPLLNEHIDQVLSLLNDEKQQA